jgi:hypothetical protein
MVTSRPIQKRHARLDDAVLFELLNAPPASRGRQPQLRGDVRNRQGASPLQDVQQPQIQVIQRRTV